jgi:basic amino acid/polyamine antiporter, APA family
MSVVGEQAKTEASTSAQPGLFARRATGLVREVSPVSAAVYNGSSAAPGLFLAISVFIVYATFPRANIILTLLIVVPIALLIAVSFSALQRTIPRSGGDYVIVSRLFHPALGVATTLLIATAAITGVGAFSYFFVSNGVQPLLGIIGTITGSSWLLDAANTLQDKTWVTVFALVFLLFGLGLVSIPMRQTMRIQNICIVIASVGLVVGFVALLFLSKDGFVHNFNSYAGAGAYEKLNAAGGGSHHSYSFRDTVFAIGTLAAPMIYQWWSIYFAGEIKQVTKRSYFTMVAPTLIFSAVFLIGVGLMLWKFDHGFLVAANTGAKEYTLASGPSWNFLASIGSGSDVLAVFLAVTFVFWLPPLAILQLLPPIRSAFAMAFDGLLPEATTKLGGRSRVPWVAVLAVGVLSIAATIWAVASPSFFQAIIYGPLFANVTMMVMALGAMLLPYRHPDLWAGGPLSGKFLGIPVLSILGFLTFIGVGFTSYVLLQPEYGIPVGKFFLYTALISLLGVVIYYVALHVQRRKGRDIALNYGEIPPE